MALSTLLTVCSVTRVAAAEDVSADNGGVAPALEVAMTYSSAAGCPTDSTFAAGLRRLTPHLKLLADANTPEHLTVAFEQRAEVFVGRLTYGETQREVSAAACADAAYALAVVVAITLDPDATVEQSGVEAKDFAEPDSSAPPSLESQVQPTAPTARPAVVAKPPSKPPVAPELDVAPRTRWTAWLGPRAAWGEVATLSWGGDLALMSTSESALGAYLLAVRAATARRDLDVTTLTFTRFGVGAAWCPRLAQSESWQLYACGGAELGYTKLATRETPEFTRRDITGGLSLIGTLDVVLTVALGVNWRLGLTPGLMVPLISNEYVLESSPGVTALSVRHQRVVGTAGLQVGYAFD